MSDAPGVDASDEERADAIRSHFHVPNEIHQICTLLAMQVVLLQDIRFGLMELLQYKREEIHR